VSNKCNNCQSKNLCAVSSDAGCWCFNYPPLEELYQLVGEQFLKSESCLCADCLKEEINRKVDQYVDLFKEGKVKNTMPAVTTRTNKLIEGLDYYLENGQWVFKAWSHLKRGYCCGSGCRHCPYPKELVK